eukprot:15349234-Ditylum_brightwellii.AAC.1
MRLTGAVETSEELGMTITVREDMAINSAKACTNAEAARRSAADPLLSLLFSSSSSSSSSSVGSVLCTSSNYYDGGVSFVSDEDGGTLPMSFNDCDNNTLNSFTVAPTTILGASFTKDGKD